MTKNSKYLVHLNTFLCEGSMLVVNRAKLNYLSYSSFCKHYALLIEKKELSERELSILTQIYKEVNPILCLTKEEFMKHIYEFFKLSADELLIYQRIASYRRKFLIN